jgi:hypothetical protein
MHTGRFSGFLIAVLCALAALGGFPSVASPALRPGMHAFEAQLRDAPICGGGRFCGTGTLAGFGAVKTQLALGPFFAGPGAGCVGVVGTRMLTLASDAKSTLRLSVKGAARGSRTWGTFKVASGSGVFARTTGSGVIIGTLSKTRRESLRYSGVLTLAGK